MVRLNNDDEQELGFLLNTGARIPALGLGTWQTGDGDLCKNAVKVALEAGYRHLDCAHLYGSEEEVGKALLEALINPSHGTLRREHLFVTSKILCSGMAPKRVESALKVSLKNLNLSYLDLFLIHWPSSSHFFDATEPVSKEQKFSPRVEEVWRAMERLMEKGLVRAIGVSNFSLSQVQQLLQFAKIIPAVNQVELHPLWRQDELVKFCQSKGIHVSAHTPLGVRPEVSMNDDSFGGMQDLSSQSLPLVYRRLHSGYIPLLTMSVVEDIAERLNKTFAQVILRWGLQRGTSVLPCSLHPERIRSNFDILDWKLSEEDWNKINSMEIQQPLSGGTSFSLNEPLQAVQEMEDDDDCSDDEEEDDDDDSFVE